MFQINKIANLKPDDPELVKYTTDVFIPGLFNWFSKNSRRMKFIPFFHSLGISAEFVSSASKEIHEPKTTLDIALEISAFRFYSMYPENFKFLSLVNYLFSIFRAGSSAHVPESVFIYKSGESENNKNLNLDDISNEGSP